MVIDRANGVRYVQNTRVGSLKIEPFGTFPGQKTEYIEVVGIPQRPREIRVDGQIVENIEFDNSRKRLRVKINDGTREVSLVR